MFRGGSPPLPSIPITRPMCFAARRTAAFGKVLTVAAPGPRAPTTRRPQRSARSRSAHRTLRSSTAELAKGTGGPGWGRNFAFLRRRDDLDHSLHNPFVGQGFFDFRSTLNANHLIAATTGGLYVSTTAGSTGRPVAACAPGASLLARPRFLRPAPTALEIDRRQDRLGVGCAAGTPWVIRSYSGRLAPSNPSVAYAWGANGATAHLWRRSGGAGRQSRRYHPALAPISHGMIGIAPWRRTATMRSFLAPSRPTAAICRARLGLGRSSPTIPAPQFILISTPSPSSRGIRIRSTRVATEASSVARPRKQLDSLQQRPGHLGVRVYRPERWLFALAHWLERRTTEPIGGRAPLHGIMSPMGTAASSR